MEEEKNPKYIIYALMVLLLVIIGISAYNMSQPQYVQGQVSNTENISSEELRTFLKTWVEYREEYDVCPSLPAISYDTTDGASQIDSDLSAWLKRRGWNINRFVYIDSRLRIIMNTILKDDEILRTRQLMQDGAVNTDSKAIAEILQQSAEQQKRSLNIEKITKAERHMVEPQLEVLKEILNCNRG